MNEHRIYGVHINAKGEPESDRVAVEASRAQKAEMPNADGTLSAEYIGKNSNTASWYPPAVQAGAAARSSTEIAALKEDAARLDWLEAGDAEIVHDSASIARDMLDGTWYLGNEENFASLRETIDFARAASRIQEPVTEGVGLSDNGLLGSMPQPDCADSYPKEQPAPSVQDAEC